VAVASATVRLTANFEANLDGIADFWTEREAPQAYARLLEELGDTVIANLERHPRIGRKFFERTAHSVEVRNRVALLLGKFGGAEVREYLSGDYVLLYCIVEGGAARKPGLIVHLLAIRHQRQLSFDFEGFRRSHGVQEGRRASPKPSADERG
jgi:plasmid stabilization system protein ParE